MIMNQFSLTDQTLIIGVKESGESHAKVVFHDGMLPIRFVFVVM